MRRGARRPGRPIRVSQTRLDFKGSRQARTPGIRETAPPTSGEPLYTMLLIGLGLRQLSAAPHNIPEVKKIIRTVTVEETVRVAQEVMRLETARDVNNYLREQTRRILPEVVS